nr:hypothetical protein [Tanacetum cinerariifolium]
MMLAHHDQLGKISITMISVAGIPRDNLRHSTLGRPQAYPKYTARDRVDENIDISIAEEKEEVPIEDDEMDDDGDHSNTNEALQWSLAKDPFLVSMKLNEQSSFMLHTIPSSISN